MTLLDRGTGTHPLPAPHLVDRSGATYPLDTARWCGIDGSPLSVTPLPGPDVEALGERGSMWRYRSGLPLPPDADPVTLGEGCTPLLTRHLAGMDVAVKVEAYNPTGSFKDRGVSAMMTALRHAGVASVLEDSSGNGGSSVAAYAAAAGLHATILAPESTSPAKILQSRLHGARVDLVPGPRQATSQEAMRRAATGESPSAAGGLVYASHSWHPMFVQGLKTIAYELWEDLGHTAPDAVITPAGGGSIALGCALGFAELYRAGHICKAPRILICQPEACAPLVEAVRSGRDHVIPGQWGATLAEGTAIAEPVRDREVLAAIRASGGAATSIAEADLPDAVQALTSTGLYAEPTSAQVVPALEQFVADGRIDPSEKVAVILTGSGYKAAAAMESLLGTPQP